MIKWIADIPIGSLSRDVTLLGTHSLYGSTAVLAVTLLSVFSKVSPKKLHKQVAVKNEGHD